MEEILNIDNKDFLVVKRFTYNNITYLYTIATDDSNELALLQEYENNGEVFIKSVNDEEQVKEVLKYMNEL